MQMVKRNVNTRIKRLKECIKCARKGIRTKIRREGLKHPNDLIYNQHYLIKSGLCEDCFEDNDLSHLEPSVKAEIQCQNWGIEPTCWRYYHIKSVRTFQKSLGGPYIEKFPVNVKKLLAKELCVMCYLLGYD